MKKRSINDFKNEADAIASKKLLRQISGGCECECPPPPPPPENPDHWDSWDDN